MKWGMKLLNRKCRNHDIYLNEPGVYVVKALTTNVNMVKKVVIK